MRIWEILPKKYHYVTLINEGNILCLSFNHVFHLNFSRYRKYLSFHLPQRNLPPPLRSTKRMRICTQQNILIKREIQVLNLQRPFKSATLMLKFTYIIRNLSFDYSQSSANRAIIPKNIITNNRMNFTSSASMIWTRYIHIHIFLLFL